MNDRIPQASEALVTARARRLVSGAGARVLVLRARPQWSGRDSLLVDGATVRVRPVPSQLAALDELGALGPDEFLVMLTDKAEHDLGDAVLVRADRQRIEPVDEWDAVAGLFHAQRLDLALAGYGPWVATALLDHQPPTGWPATATGVVTSDHALGNLLAHVLGMPLPASVDDVTLLTALDEHPAREAWHGLPEQVRLGLTRWANDALGATAGLALTAAARSRTSVVAIGLALDVLWPAGAATPTPAQGEARGRIQSAQFGTARVTALQARAFATVARTIALRSAATDSTALAGVFAQATRLLEDDLAWPDGVARSDVLPGGLQARLHDLATLLARADTETLPDMLHRIEGALGDVLAHEGAHARHGDVQAARMAVRLARRLAVQESLDLPSTLGAALRGYVDDGAWIDRAAAVLWDGASDDAVAAAYGSVVGEGRRAGGAAAGAGLDRAAAVLWDGASDDAVAAAYGSLLAMVRRDRDAYDKVAATLLAQPESGLGDVVLIENVLRDVVAPLAPMRPLLVVLDGMSVPVALEIVEAATSEGWLELVAGSARTPVLSALPSLTRWSRTALLTGAPAVGSQASEVAGIRDRGGVLFHKDDLRSAGGESLAAAVREAIDDPDRAFVAVVLNTIDDALDKQDPGGTRWGLDDVQHLRALLNAAALAGRAVILTSDHGHVVERGSQVRSHPGAQTRWRPATGAAPDADEVLVTGPRVKDGAAILPWREGVRYGTLHSGYHGGASLAEITVPLVVLTRTSGKLPAGWRVAAPQAPVWWNESRLPEPAPATRRAQRLLAGAVVDAVPAPTEPAPRPAAARRAEAAGQGTLGFDVADQPSSTLGRDPVAELVAAYEASPVAAEQRQRAGRRAVGPVETAAALRVLLAGGGRAHRDTVASALDVPSSSFAPSFAALGRLLNVEGYPVVSMDGDGVTACLDEALLREQFGLGRRVQ